MIHLKRNNLHAEILPLWLFQLQYCEFSCEKHYYIIIIYLIIERYLSHLHHSTAHDVHNLGVMDREHIFCWEWCFDTRIHLLYCVVHLVIDIYLCIDGYLLTYINLSQIPSNNKTNKLDAHHYVNIDLLERLSP